MGVEIIAYQNDLFCVWVLFVEEDFYLVRPVAHSAVFLRANRANSCFWLAEHKDAGSAVSFVFVVVSLGLTGFYRQGDTGFLR